MADSQLRVLSLNCWGLKYVSKNREDRIQAIAQQLSQYTHDIIALQEIWVFSDYEKVKDSVSNQMPYSKFFYSGALGSGLAIFTRFPIISTSIHPYSLNGSPIDVSAGDWFVGKAAAHIIVLHPVLGQVQIFNTHLFAKGGEDGPEYHRAHRLVNAYEFAKLARGAADHGRYVIALGDFNSIPSSVPMKIIQDHAALNDSWEVTHPSGNSTTATTALEAITKYGITADSPLNSWTAGKGYAYGTWGKRLDYVLYRQPRRPASFPGESFPALKARDCKVVMIDKVPGCNFSYSDHFGVEATLEIQITPEAESSSVEYALPELSAPTVATAIQALTACYRFSRERARRELTVFGLCLLLLAAITAGSAWLPHPWINPMLILFTIFISWLGTTMLYQGFLYGNWECNALMNVIEELEISLRGLELQANSQRGI